MQSNRAITSVLAAIVLIGGLSIVPVARAGEGNPASAPANSGAAQEAAATSSTKSDVLNEIEQLRRLVEAQNGRIDKLESDLAAAHQGNGSAPLAPSSESTVATKAVPSTSAVPVATSAAPVPTEIAIERVAQKELVLNKKVDKLDSKLKGFGPFTFSGDIRLRHESFLSGGATNAAPTAIRNRERYRLRFNATAKINNDLSGGFTLASGDLGDPISTNSTETGFFTRKPIAVDRAFALYTPTYFKPLSVTAGKFGYTWDNTELTFDKDINVEGASEKVSWDWNHHVFSHFALVALELPLFEVGAGPDSDILGGQLQTGWRLGSHIKIAADTAFYDYQNPDAIAQNQTNGNGFATQGTSTGQGGNFGFSAATLTNSFGVIGGKREFASRFGILDSLFKLDIDTGLERFPLTALFNFEQNTRACQNVNAFVVASVAISCNPRDRQGYWAEAKFGQNKKKGDFSFDYVFAHIEREATVAAFVASDFRQPTNVVQHRVGVSYNVYGNVTTDFTAYIGRQLATAQTPTPERWLNRLQMDVNYKF